MPFIQNDYVHPAVISLSLRCAVVELRSCIGITGNGKLSLVHSKIAQIMEDIRRTCSRKLPVARKLKISLFIRLHRIVIGVTLNAETLVAYIGIREKSGETQKCLAASLNVKLSAALSEKCI